MNLSLTSYDTRQSDPYRFNPDIEVPQDAIEEHQAVMSSTGFTLTGRTVLLTEGPEYPGSYQVWSETEQPGDERWVYIDPEGVAWYRACPTGCE